jgi:hypothetical protein
MIAFWATPKMTLGHLVFAIATTAYMLIAIQLEEGDLTNIHGESYQQYKREVSMLLPVPKKLSLQEELTSNEGSDVQASPHSQFDDLGGVFELRSDEAKR